jgi:hypothetical protein
MEEPMRIHRSGALLTLVMAVVGWALTTSPALAAGKADGHTSTVFAGAKVNAGTVTHERNKEGKQVLVLSSDFVSPDTPDPHWQVVDSDGTVYLLQRLGIKGDKVNTSIVLPPYVKNVAKVQIWCAWAEAVLGEASFATPVS